MHKRNKTGSVGVAALLAGTFGLLFLAALIFGIWSFMGMQDYKNNVEPKIEAAVEVAKAETATAKDNEFLEKEKLPVRTYSGPETYGAVTFTFPKTWSMTTAEASSTIALDGTLHPITVPGSGLDSDFSYALRMQVVDKPYSASVKEFDSSVKKGLLASPYRAKLVESVLGTRFDGEIAKGKTGSIILLPIRDKTLKIWTESNDYKADFDNIIMPSLSFQP